ncbi:MAG: hypothetical protein Q4C42_04395 [Clostridia bacterium]|nr:hypothetical protein [Clostridia bacterium]
MKRLYRKDRKWLSEKEVRAVYDKNKNNESLWRIVDGKVFFRVKIKAVCFGCAVDRSSEKYKESIKWLKNYNESCLKKDRIEVIRYIPAQGDRYQFIKDKDYNYLNELTDGS